MNTRALCTLALLALVSASKVEKGTDVPRSDQVVASVHDKKADTKLTEAETRLQEVGATGGHPLVPKQLGKLLEGGPKTDAELAQAISEVRDGLLSHLFLSDPFQSHPLLSRPFFSHPLDDMFMRPVFSTLEKAAQELTTALTAKLDGHTSSTGQTSVTMSVGEMRKEIPEQVPEAWKDDQTVTLVLSHATQAPLGAHDSDGGPKVAFALTAVGPDGSRNELVKRSSIEGLAFNAKSLSWGLPGNAGALTASDTGARTPKVEEVEDES